VKLPQPYPAADLRGTPAVTVTWTDPVAKAIDDYLLMERKARAWDALYTLNKKQWNEFSVALMDELLAQTVAPDTLKP
jgi:hypothetical protein